MSEEELYRDRLRKAEALRARGVEPWPVRFDRTHLAAELQDRHAALEPGAESGERVRVAGRLMTTRTQGKLAFADLADGSGRIQLFCSGEAVAALDELDSGDIVGASGEVIRTKRGELSVRVDELVLLSKALRPLPDKWHGLKDTEVRFRQRYLDLLANPDARRLAELRTAVVSASRGFFDSRGFLEVETPILHPVPGGAAARPFVTHHNALDLDLYLRIAPELYLKRLLVGGIERVYEIGRTFRNEGIGYRWNPEFTLLEAYQAYADYTDVMETMEAYYREVAEAAAGSATIEFEGHRIDFGRPWRRLRFVDAVGEAVGRPISFEDPIDDLRELASKHGVDVQPWWGHGTLIAELYEELVEPNIVEPTFIMDHPLEISPLARTHRDDPNLVERFEPIVLGRELGNAFSELIDPVEQRRRFERQMIAREHGDVEANPIDEPFLRALEHGMPPAGGLGVGIDRFVMLLGGVHTIREVILFPTLRPEAPDRDDLG